jgi:hypothetical protein
MLSSRAPITRLQGWRPFLYVSRVLLLVEQTRIKPLDVLMETITPEAELISPLSRRMVCRDRDDLRVLLGAV